MRTAVAQIAWSMGFPMFAGIAFPASTFQSAMGTWRTELAILSKQSMRATFAKPAQVSCLAMFAGTANAAISSFLPMFANTSQASFTGSLRTSYSSLGCQICENCIRFFSVFHTLQCSETSCLGVGIVFASWPSAPGWWAPRKIAGT